MCKRIIHSLCVTIPMILFSISFLRAASIQSSNPKLLLRLNNVWTGWQVFGGSVTMNGDIQLNGTCTGTGCGGGGSSLAVGTGSPQAVNIISSPTTTMAFSSGTHEITLVNQTTVYIKLNFSSVTAQGNVLLTVAGSTQALASFFSTALSTTISQSDFNVMNATHSRRIDELQVFSSTGQIQIYAISLDTGNFRSAFNTFTSTNDAEHTKITNFSSTSSIRIDQLQVFASTAQQQIYALSLDTGTLLPKADFNVMNTTHSSRLQDVQVSTGLLWASVASTHTAFRNFSSTNDADHSKIYNLFSTHSLVNDTQNSTITALATSTGSLYNAFYLHNSTADALILSSKPDSLGVHIATQNLDMSSFSILNVTTITFANGTKQITAPGLIKRSVIINTNTVTITPQPKTQNFFIRLVGGGGGGGGVGATQTNGAGGGGAGGYLETWVAVNSTTNYIIAVGTAGTGGGSTPANGLGGGDTKFVYGGSTLTAFGGFGGTLKNSGTCPYFVAAGAGGSASGGDLNISGQSGGRGACFANGIGWYAMGGTGGSNMYGHGGQYTTGLGSVGNNGVGYGSGGGGAEGLASGNAGGDGAQGLIIIEEY